MLIGLVAEGGEGERESHSKVGTLLGPTKIYPPLIKKKKNYGSPPEKKLQPLISAFIKNPIIGKK